MYILLLNILSYIIVFNLSTLCLRLVGYALVREELVVELMNVNQHMLSSEWVCVLCVSMNNNCVSVFLSISVCLFLLSFSLFLCSIYGSIYVLFSM